MNDEASSGLARGGEWARQNLLIFWADEAQRFMTASEDGTSDYNCVDRTCPSNGGACSLWTITEEEERRRGTRSTRSPPRFGCRSPADPELSRFDTREGKRCRLFSGRSPWFRSGPAIPPPAIDNLLPTYNH